MFAYIKGRIEYKQADHIIIETGGIGYKVFTSLNTLQSSDAAGDEIKVYTYLYVREDDMRLYGFLTPDELKMFELLISVTGIGPKAAVSLMSYMTPSSFILAVIMEDIKAMIKTPGIGKKTAQRIILELKDKLKKGQGELAELSHRKDVSTIGKESKKAQEAIAALIVLGYNPLEAARAVSRVYSEESSIETIIKDSLKEMM